MIIDDLQLTIGGVGDGGGWKNVKMGKKASCERIKDVYFLKHEGHDGHEEKT